MDINYDIPIVIAEIGASHIGNMDRAKKLIDLAKLSGADIAKFQKRNPIESTPASIRDKPHPNKIFSYGETYLQHRIALELSIEQHAELQKHCNSIGIEYSTSVWDLTSAKEVIELNPGMIKIPSAQNHNTNMIEYIYSNYGGTIHLSLGMSNNNDYGNIKSMINSNDPKRTVVYHCTSIYPCPFENLYLKEISRLKNDFENVGFSNHGYGIATDIAAYVLGAKWFERHFIDDRCFRHNDAAASLEPSGMSRLTRDLSNVFKAMAPKPTEMPPEELEQRNKLRGC